MATRRRTTEGVAARVARGAKLLDVFVPGWRARIDVATLDLFDAEYCILGQLYGGSEVSGVADLGISDRGCYWCGFRPPPICGDATPHYRQLTAAWLDYIRAARDQSVIEPAPVFDSPLSIDEGAVAACA